MSIFVSVHINNELRLTDLKIGSQSWPKEPDDVDEFFVQTLTNDGWGTELGFMHRYGDGMGICVQKAINTVLKNKPAAKTGHSW